ncbi:MAG: DUF4169 family protein [Xanthobacteraceae bacterium]
MADIVNLRAMRKRAKREKAAEHAAENRVRYGMSKVERKQLAAEQERAARDLDQRRIDTGEDR